jgi:hypothetical protein
MARQYTKNEEHAFDGRPNVYTPIDPKIGPVDRLLARLRKFYKNRLRYDISNGPIIDDPAPEATEQNNPAAPLDRRSS